MATIKFHDVDNNIDFLTGETNIIINDHQDTVYIIDFILTNDIQYSELYNRLRKSVQFFIGDQLISTGKICFFLKRLFDGNYRYQIGLYNIT